MTFLCSSLDDSKQIPCSCAPSSAAAICFAIGSASVDRDSALRDAVRQRGTLDQLHHERGRVVALLEPVNLRDVRMIQSGERLGLALESGETIRIVGERFGQYLDGDLASEVGVGRPIIPRRPAGPERDPRSRTVRASSHATGSHVLPSASRAALADRGDLVDAEAGARGEGQRCGLYARGGDGAHRASRSSCPRRGREVQPVQPRLAPRVATLRGLCKSSTSRGLAR